MEKLLGSADPIRLQVALSPAERLTRTSTKNKKPIERHRVQQLSWKKKHCFKKINLTRIKIGMRNREYLLQFDPEFWKFCIFDLKKSHRTKTKLKFGSVRFV